jgi:hypothetical protein
MEKPISYETIKNNKKLDAFFDVNADEEKKEEI